MTAIENQLKLLEKVNKEKEQIETEIGELTETNESVRRYIELRQKQESIKTDMEELASDIGETIEEEEWKPDKISKGKKRIYRRKYHLAQMATQHSTLEGRRTQSSSDSFRRCA